MPEASNKLRLLTIILCETIKIAGLINHPIKVTGKKTYVCNLLRVRCPNNIKIIK